MKLQEAKKKYKKYWKAMGKYMDGITMSFDIDGDTNIPERDLIYAYNMVMSEGKTSGGIEWD